MASVFSKSLSTPDEVAEYLGLAVKTLNVWRFTKRYILPYTKIGRLVRYRAEDVEAFVTSRIEGEAP